MPKTMKLIEESTGKMECKTCGSVHFANLRPSIDGGGYYRGAWKCSNQACPTNQRA